MEPGADGRSSEEERRPAPGGGGGGGAVRARRATGRLVESTQAEDRRLIALVGARPLLYARSTLPVASYYSQVKQLWQEVADLMGWTVAEVRRKWSHIRNSYSRHLRNEIHGLRTGRGRMVSRWYLADDLEFLRHHMATDTRPSSYSMVSQYAPTLLELECGERQELVASAAVPAWYAAPEAPPPRDTSCSATSFESDDNADYFHFFRGIYEDYRELRPADQRKFRRQCLLLLHELLDGAGGGRAGGAATPAQGEGEGSDDADTDQKVFVHNLEIIHSHHHDDDDDGGGGGDNGEHAGDHAGDGDEDGT